MEVSFQIYGDLKRCDSFPYENYNGSTHGDSSTKLRIEMDADRC